jgi:hypothetical protein
MNEEMNEIFPRYGNFEHVRLCFCISTDPSDDIAGALWSLWSNLLATRVYSLPMAKTGSTERRVRAKPSPGGKDDGDKDESKKSDEQSGADKTMFELPKSSLIDSIYRAINDENLQIVPTAPSSQVTGTLRPLRRVRRELPARFRPILERPSIE